MAWIFHFGSVKTVLAVETLISSFLFEKPVQSNLRKVSIYFDIHVYSHDEWMETTYGT